METVPITIIGGGAVGCAIAHTLSQSTDRQIAVVERNSGIRAENQSSRNSGVVHSPIHYSRSKMPLKARFCAAGNKLLYDFCQRHNVPCRRTGKLIVATDALEADYLEDVLKIATDNAVSGVRLIDGRAVAEYEPNVKATAALYVPTSGIIDSFEFVNKLFTLASVQGAIFAFGTKVIGIEPSSSGFVVKTETNGKADSFETGLLINASGLYSDEVARMVEPDSPYEMELIKGEAAKFYKTRQNISMRGMSVYPVPRGYWPNGERAEVPFAEYQKLLSEGKVFKSLGVHLTPTFNAPGSREIGETVTIGPSYSAPQNKEDYSQARGTEYYLKMAKPFFPNLERSDITLHQAGIRAKLKGHADFVIERSRAYPQLINLIGIDSPGLTASLAIARYVGGLAKE